jgi:hypothetical protein
MVLSYFEIRVSVESNAIFSASALAQQAQFRSITGYVDHPVKR